jgi:hypothetical protein
MINPDLIPFLTQLIKLQANQNSNPKNPTFETAEIFPGTNLSPPKPSSGISMEKTDYTISLQTTKQKIP